MIIVILQLLATIVILKGHYPSLSLLRSLHSHLLLLSQIEVVSGGGVQVPWLLPVLSKLLIPWQLHVAHRQDVVPSLPVLLEFI